MSYLVRLPLEILAMIIAYLTNWLVVFFADERGNLPHILRYWQTYDSTLDVRWLITEKIVPKIFRYDYDKHYIYHQEIKDDELMIPAYVELKDSNFTFKEKVQRYFCRVWWLYRNSNYGFSYEVNGKVVDGEKIRVLEDINEPNNEQWVSYESGKSLWSTVWCIFYCKQYCKWFRLRIYLGWKLKGVQSGLQKHMLAFCINPFKKLER